MPKIAMYAVATKHQQMVKCAIMDTIFGLEAESSQTRPLLVAVFKKNKTTEARSTQQQSSGRKARVPLLALLFSFCGRSI